MISRYDLWIQDMLCEDVAQLIPHERGAWVKYGDAEEKINFSIEILSNLKASDISKNSPEQLNTIVDHAIEVLKK